MIDLHTHTLFSDGEMIPAELTRRAAVLGYRAIALTDHGDLSNLDMIIPRVVRVADDLSVQWGLKVVPGIELTHVPPAQYAEATAEARRLGAIIVNAHGETIVEPVATGTNRAALEAGVDILTHPGLISDVDAELAAKKGICLEITTRKGHSLTNGHVVQMARRHGASLVVNNDAHAPGDLLKLDLVRMIALGAGMTEAEFNQASKNSERLAGI